MSSVCTEPTSAVLQVSDLSMRFGGLLAVDGVSLSVGEKQIVSMIGPNGAGKTTVFNCLTGFYQPTGGKIVLRGQDITGQPGHEIARRGVVRTFQNVRLFRGMTAVENLLVAQHRHLKSNMLAGLFKTPGFRQSEKQALDFAGLNRQLIAQRILQRLRTAGDCLLDIHHNLLAAATIEATNQKPITTSIVSGPKAVPSDGGAK